MSLPSGPSPTAPAISMSLLQFDKTVVLSECGKIYESPYIPTFDQWDATAQCDVPLIDIKKMFAFQSDHFDVNDADAEDIRFYVDNGAISPLNVRSNIVYSGEVINTNQTGGSLSGSDMLVQKDYVRHLAKLLFNTAYGVDLFINEDALVESVAQALEQAWMYCINDLLSISLDGDNSNLQGAENHKYLRHDAKDAQDNDKFNICRELFKMMVSRAPSRFTDLPTLSVNAEDGDESTAIRIDPAARNLYRLPFIVGDQLVMRVVIKPCEHQTSYKDADADAVVQANERAYLLYLNLV